MISVGFQGKPFNTTLIQVYAPTTNAEEAEAEWFCEDLQDLIKLTPKKKKNVLFIIGDWTAKVGSQDTWSNRKVWSWNKKKQGRVNRVLPRKHTGHSRHPRSTTQEMTLHVDITRWSTLKSD